MLLQEDFLAHRGRPHVYLQRIQLNNPTERVAALQTVGPTAGPAPRAFTSTLEKVGDHQFLLYSGRSPPVPTGLVHLVVVAAKKLVDRLQVAPRTQLDETVLWVVHVSGPLNPQVLKSKAAKELKVLQDLARKEMLELLEMPAAELLQDHQRLWAQLFSPGEVRLCLPSTPCSMVSTAHPGDVPAKSAEPTLKEGPGVAHTWAWHWVWG